MTDTLDMMVIIAGGCVAAFLLYAMGVNLWVQWKRRRER